MVHTEAGGRRGGFVVNVLLTSVITKGEKKKSANKDVNKRAFCILEQKR